MLQQGVITSREYRRTRSAPMPKPQDVHLSGVQGQAPYFGEYVKQQLIEKLGAKRVFGGGFRVYTTIDLRLQKLARDAIHEVAAEPDGAAGGARRDQPDATGACSRWSAAATSTRASSTSRCRASASPGRRSSRSCSRPR